MRITKLLLALIIASAIIVPALSMPDNGKWMNDDGNAACSTCHKLITGEKDQKFGCQNEASMGPATDFAKAQFCDKCKADQGYGSEKSMMGQDGKQKCGQDDKQKTCGCENSMMGQDGKQKCGQDDKQKTCGCEKSMMGQDGRKMGHKNMKSMMGHDDNVGVKLVVVNLIVK
jgi:hypothetical protein